MSGRPESGFAWSDWLVAAGLGAAAAWLYRGTLDAALLGADTLPLIAASRIESFSDFVGTFREVMMDGRYPAGDFYRPTQNLFLAFDHALWGLDAFGYQLTTLLLFAGCTALSYLCARALLGTRNGAIALGPVCAGLFVLLHRSPIGVMGIPSRRPELLLLFFLLCMLLALPRAPSAGRRHRLWLAAGCALLAAGAKEAGVIAVVIVFVHQWCYASERTGTARTLDALRATAPSFAAVALVLLNRLLVLGGLGGYRRAPAELEAANSLQMLSDTMTALFLPHRWHDTRLGELYPALACALLVACAALAFASQRARGQRAPATRSTLTVGAAWLLALIVIYGFARQYAVRYSVPCLGAMGLILAALVEEPRATLRAAAARSGRALSKSGEDSDAGSELKGGDDPEDESGQGDEAGPLGAGPLRIAAACQLAAVLGVVAISLSNTPASRDHAARDQATRVQEAMFDTLARAIDAAPAEGRIEVAFVPPVTEPMLRRYPELARGEAPPAELLKVWRDSFLREKRTPTTGILPERSLQAWAELAYPQRSIRVVAGPREPRDRPRPNELRVVVRLDGARARHLATGRTRS